MSAFLRRPRVLIALGLLAVLAAGAGVAAWLVVSKEPGDVSNPNVEFDAPAPTTTPPATTPTTPTTPSKPRRPQKPRTVNWPRYGYTQGHTRVFAPDHALNGPWRRMWVRRAPALTEFPPVIWDGTLYLLVDDGTLMAFKANNGRMRWRRQVGALAASSPAVDEFRLYVVLLEGAKGSRKGKIMSLSRRTGRVFWSKGLPSRGESSPLLRDGKVFFGTEDGTMYALDARSGRQIWTYHASGAIKGSPSYDAGKLYFGSYGGDVHAVRASDGKLLWKSGAARGLVRSGNFYATAAVAFGRVYIGSTDGREYSFASRTGKLAWARQTGGYVYSSAAVDNVPDVGPTVFVGSYDGRFYAFDARSGRTRWTYDAGGRISGSPTVIGTTVYFANLAKRETVGLSTAHGRVVFRRSAGSFDPMVTDGQWLYLTGSSSVTALRQIAPRTPEQKRAARARAAAKRAAARRRAAQQRAAQRRAAAKKRAAKRKTQAAKKRARRSSN
ncbi:outer membrane protein assembly factor BamB family protein [Capillimicrobium parvum]|uniref:Outer membrane protein assembly factor BamB n=1 Tax=Capillimicrobium parvum TaxID=2884022 RepID=A0A9E6XXS3_9ACTN|nr:PQQ-binding-like beta-propeller repeat protein [Capillimicrobium parvum]UGS36190.1 Outer membrane protein assembly factor BamB [Capillimicrobium parvum]